MSWIFEVTTGKQISPTGEVLGIGYAGGDCGLHPEAVNNPVMESLEDIGPLPCGNYTADRVVLVHPHLGNYAVHLSPDPETRAKIIAYGRNPDSFYWHGDNFTKVGQRAASDGCIVGALDVRTDFWSGIFAGGVPDRELQVIAKLQETIQ